MNIDEQIKHSLQAEQQQLDQVISHEAGLFSRLGDAYQGSMRRWMWLSTLLAILLSIGFLYAGYRFFVAVEVSEQLFWALCFVVGLMMQMTVKLWMFMEMNRTALLKEIKRSELNILQAIQKVGH